ncbi:MAG: prephenate dehydrogenase [Micrococcus sp.]|nr:prephenate dehydrogenase [Micrococcus sp.]
MSPARPGTALSGLPEPVLIRGTGLLGTSIGLGLRARGVRVELHDPSPSALAVAQDIGAGCGVELDDAAPGTVVVAAPPDVTGRAVVDSLQRWPDAVVLDIASVKGAIHDEVDDAVAAGAISAEDRQRYVGTHPMAGRERSGPVAARGTLFTAAPWVVCVAEAGEDGEHRGTADAAITAATTLATAVGATVHTMTAQDHDASVALISHLPQIAASLVASRLQDTEATSLALAGNGLRDTTRIAASDPQLWVQILSANAGHLVQTLQGVREDLDRLIGTLQDPSAPGARLDIAQLIAEGNAGQARIPGKHGAPPQAFSVVTVIVDDTPGQIAAVLAATGEAGVNVEDLRMDHASGHEVGMLEISVLPGRREALSAALTQRGWKVV